VTGLEILAALALKAIAAKVGTVGAAKAALIGGKAIASHGGLTSLTATHAAATAHSAGVIEAARQTAHIATHAGYYLAAAGGTAAAVEALRNDDAEGVADGTWEAATNTYDFFT
jgi:hypothetical protein